MFKSLLVPIDFSSPSRRALDVATHLVDPSEGRIHVLTVLDRILLRGKEAEKTIGAAQDALEKKVSALADLYPRLAGRIDGRVDVDVPWHAIVRASDKGHDAVVMGTSARKGIDRWVLGSVAERVARLCRVPVVVSPPKRKAGPIREILLATDFSKASSPAAAHAIETASALGAHLTVLTVTPDLVAAVDFEVTLSLYRRQLAALKKESSARLKAFVSKHRKDVPKLSSLSRVGPAADMIVRAAGELKSDLVVVGTHGESGFFAAILGSIARSVLRKSPCPVMVVKPVDFRSAV
jgi:nucleotide-binding universal stress UspA family protein